VPQKIKIFFWYLRRGVVLTKDNLVKHRVANIVAFASMMRQFSTCFLEHC
jgi:hypothetical protein